MFENLRHIDQVNHLLAQAGCGHLLQFQRIAHRRHVGDELTRGLHMEFLLGGTGAGTAGKPGKFLTSQIATFRFTHVGLAIAFHALQHVCGIAAFKRLDFAVMHLPHGFAHFVEEPTVMGDEQQRAGSGRPTVLQMFRQPVNGHHIQMVCRLVECENIPILEQQACQISAATLTAGKRTDFRFQADAAKQCFDDFARLGFRSPFVVFTAFERSFAHGGVVVERITLVEHAERKPAANGHATGIRLLRAFEQMQQRGLAVAVLTDDADAIAFKNTLRYIVENILGRKSKRNVFKSQIISRHKSPM